MRFISGRGNTVVFGASFAQGTAGRGEAFRVPKHASMIAITSIGSGAGGGNGTLGTGTNRGGGGGGGSGGIARIVVPAICLPSKLFIYVPSGGLAATDGGTALVTAVQTDVSASPVKDVILASNTIGSFAKKGANATTTGGAGGAAAVVGVATDHVWTFFAIPTWIAGQAGTAGGTGVTTATAGTAVTWGAAGIPLSGGAGGGGTTSGNGTAAGGAITGVGLIATIAGGLAGVKGNAGWNFQNTIGHGAIFASSGGAGGGGGGASAGGDGGLGGFGSGGGGGGGGQGTAGAGGRGGDGLCVLTWW